MLEQELERRDASPVELPSANPLVPIYSDSFYYEQLYDRFTQRFYDVVPIESVRTLPADVLNSLRAFDFLVTDAGKGTDFTSKEVCATCSAGAIPTDSVQCVDCTRTFHMRCLDPPLARKPGKGFAWTCVQCQAKKQTLFSGSVLAAGTPDPSPKTKGKPAASEAKPQAPKVLARDKSKRKPLWPFRYVGDYARFHEVLGGLFELLWPTAERYVVSPMTTSQLPTEGADDDTVIYPRAQSRIGRKYQADLPDVGGTTKSIPIPDEETSTIVVPTPTAPSNTEGADNMDEDTASGHVSPPNASTGEYRHKGRIPLWRKRLMMQEEAKDSGEADSRQHPMLELVFSVPEETPEAEVENFIEETNTRFAGPNRIDYVDRSMTELHRTNYDVEAATQVTKSLKPSDIDLADWSAEDVRIFEEGVVKYGHDLFGIGKEVGFCVGSSHESPFVVELTKCPQLPTKRRRDIVKFFYHWKKSLRYVEVYSQYCRKYRPK